MNMVVIDGWTDGLMEVLWGGSTRRDSLWNNLSERKKDGQNRRDHELLSTFSPARPVETALKVESR